MSLRRWLCVVVSVLFLLGLVVVQVLQGGLLSIGTPDMIQETLDFYRNASISSISSHVIRATRQAARTSNLRGGEEAEVTTKPIEMGQKKESKAKSPRGTDQIDARSPMADRMKARLSRTHGVSARFRSTDGIKARFPSDRDIESMVREGLYIESHEKLKESILWATEYENRSSKTVEQAVEEYKRRYQREPPASFGKWVDYALANKCEIDNYDMIEPYFQVFRKNGGITKEMVRAAMRLQSVGYYTINNNEIKDNGCWTYEFLGIILREFVHILSGTSFTFVVNCFDEPRFLYPSDLKGNRLSDPFDLAKAPDINKVIYDNANSIGKEILRNCWQIDRVRRNFNYHYFLTHANRPLQTQLGVIFSQATIPGCTTDIPIPANYHWGRRNAKFADNATFDNKLHGFVWRGSSTGGEIQSRVIEWASHHRLRFQRLFGSSNNADVGITAIIQASSAKDVNKYHPTVNRTSEEAQATHKFLMISMEILFLSASWSLPRNTIQQLSRPRFLTSLHCTLSGPGLIMFQSSFHTSMLTPRSTGWRSILRSLKGLRNMPMRWAKSACELKTSSAIGHVSCWNTEAFGGADGVFAELQSGILCQSRRNALIV